MYLWGQLVSFLFFTVAAYISFYIPGRFILQKANLVLSKIDNFFLSVTTGIVTFILTSYIFAYIKLPFLTLLLLDVLLIYVLLRKRELLYPKVTITDKWSAIIILLGTLSFLGITFFSGWMTPGGLRFVGINATDGIMHIGFIRDEAIHFPPMHISLAGSPMRGYHYFYDFLASRFNLFYHLNILDLQFRWFPLLFAIFYGLGFYVVTRKFSKSRVAKRFVLLSAYFSQSLVFIYALFLKGQDITDGFGIPQPITLITDPSVILSIFILFSGIFLLTRKDKSPLTIFIIACLFGILAEVKVYTGIIGILGLVVYSVHSVILKKEKIISNIILLFLTAVIAGGTFLPNNLGAGGLSLRPLLIYEQFMRGAIFNWTHWGVIYDIYSTHHNIPRLIQMNLIALAVFWIGNLGIRSVVFFNLKKIFEREFWKKGENVLLTTTILSALLVPSLFIQSFSVFNIMQLLWIFIVILSIPVGITLGNLFEIPGKINKILIILILIIFWTPGYINREVSYMFLQKPFVISQKDLNIFSFVEMAVPYSGQVIVLPKTEKDRYGQTIYNWNPMPYVAAMTGRYTYLEDEDLAFNPKLEIVAQQRKQMVYSLIDAFSSCDLDKVGENAGKMHSSYIFSFNDYPCVATSSAVVNTISSEKLHFYQVKQL